MKIITLTLPTATNTPVFVAADKIEYFSANPNGGSTVALAAHNNGGLRVKESPEKILQMLTESNSM